MSLRNISIRLRLTFWCTAVLIFILALVSADIYGFMRSKLESMVRTKLDEGFATVEAVVWNSGGDLMDVVHLGQDMPFQLMKSGEVAYVTTTWKRIGFPSQPDSLTFNPYGTWTSPEGREYRIKLADVPEVGYKLAYAQDASERREILGEVATVFQRAFPFAMLLSIFGGYWLAGRALSPVRTIIHKAREITAESLSERLPVLNPHDEIGRLSTVFNDTLARLENSFNQLRRFTADASHELRTPLTAIRSVGEVALKRAPDSDSYREAIASMLIETEHLSRLLDNLLTLARSDSGKAHISAEPLDISHLTGEVVEELRVLAEEKGQSLHVDAPSPVMVTADSAILKQALINIIHNAIRYTQAGGRIEVKVEASLDGQAIIDIIDNGPGIPKDERAKVFERFYRTDKARSRKDGGAGLGLAIARWAVEANKGQVEFCDREEAGTCCRITLSAS
ncbi:HAMP domain-containing protein [bacterium]|nr:HAMP domain-containing protein [bacterium]